MKILLLSMPNTIMAFNKAAKFPNLGLASIAGNLEKGHDIAIADLILRKRNLRNYLLNLLKNFSPHVVGLSCFSFQYDTAIQIAKMAKSLEPSTQIILGGYHPTLWYDNISEENSLYIDFVVRNEGEKTFQALIRALEGKEDFSKIAGLSYKEEGEFRHNPPRGNLDLQEIKLPNREARILSGYHAWGWPCDVIETSRGCTFDCTFCTIIKMYGRTFRCYPMERIIRDIRDATSRGARIIFMADDNITLNMQHLEKVCEAILASRLNHIHYITQASVQGISSSKKIVDKMAKAGFKTIFLGIENIGVGNLEFFGKDNQVTLERIENAVAYLRENRIIVLGAIIVGNPDDTEESMWQNYFLLKRLKIDGPIFFNPTPLPQTEMRNDMIKRGLLINPTDFSWYMGTKANTRTYYLSQEEINRIVLKMNIKFLDFSFFRTNNIRRHYPGYFYRRLLRELVDALWKEAASRTRFRDRDPLRAALKRDMKRRKGWLLGDLNDTCPCYNCAFGRGEENETTHY